MLLNCGVREDSWEFLGLQGDQASPSSRKSVLNTHWKDLMLKLKLQYFGHLMRELTLLKRPWCWERLRAGGEGDNRGWNGWMASLTQWTWVWVGSGSWWWTGRPGVLRFMGSQRVGHDWATELNWTELNWNSAEILHKINWHRNTYLIIEIWSIKRSRESKTFFDAQYFLSILQNMTGRCCSQSN